MLLIVSCCSVVNIRASSLLLLNLTQRTQRARSLFFEFDAKEQSWRSFVF